MEDTRSDVQVVLQRDSKPVWGGWGKTAVISPRSLGEVMSEELVEQLHVQQTSGESFHVTDSIGDLDVSLFTEEQSDTSDDLMIAQFLQYEMDAEHDRELKREENMRNGTNKVKVTFDKYRSVHPALQLDSDSQYSDNIEVFEPMPVKDTTPCFNGKGISGKGKSIVTKHDATICSRKNVNKVMETFPPGFETGDDSSLDMRLPNSVFNKLKVHSNIDSKKAHRLHEKKEHSTAEQAVDAKTRLIMYKLVNSGVLSAINGVISTGKESVVFHADGGSLANEMVPRECALKVFKTTLTEFKNRCQYVRGDVRFFKDEFKKQNPRKIMRIWAEKEEMNLKRMKKFGIPCPTVVLLKKHILVLSFLGDNQNPAPILKEAKLSAHQWQIAYDQCVMHVKTMYKSCLLVHADLSEYNILWYQDQVYFIDVSQAVDARHPNAMEFLLRDCTNLSEFFTKRGVSRVLNAHELFNDVTGLSLSGEGKDFLSAIEKYEKDERRLKLGMSKTDYPFDYFFDQACSERMKARSAAEDDDGVESDSEESDDEK